MKQQAERYAKAKMDLNRVKEVRENRTSNEKIQVLSTVVSIDKKLEVAEHLRKEQVRSKQTKAMAHNKLVSSRIYKLCCDFDKSQDFKMERLKAKIRQAAMNRGTQLLQIKQTAEKLRKRRNSDSTSVQFDIEFVKGSQISDNSVRQRLEEWQKQ